MPDYGGPGGFGGRGGGEAATGGVGGSGYGGRSRGQNQRGTNYSQSLARAINEANARARAKSLAARKAKAAQEAIQNLTRGRPVSRRENLTPQEQARARRIEEGKQATAEIRQAVDRNI